MSEKCSFRAGICRFENGRVIPDAEKGLVALQVQEDELLHFLWSRRDVAQTVPELDFILFPGDAEFKSVGNRVFVLKFQSSGDKKFFWMQDPDANSDEKIQAKVNSLINDMMDEDEETLNLAASFAPHQRNIQPLPSVSDFSQRSIQLSTLQNILKGIKVPESEPDIELEDVVNIKTVAPILDDPEVIGALAPYLPEGLPATKAEIEEIVRSPQFLQSLQTLSVALRSGQLQPLMAQLGLHGNPDSSQGVFGFVQAIQDQTKKENLPK